MDKENFHNKYNIEEKNEFRIKYYLGNVNKEIELNETELNITLFDDTRILRQKTRADIEEGLREFFHNYIKAIHYFDPCYVIYNNYYDDLYTYLHIYRKKTRNFNIKYIFWFGDETGYKEFPCFVKAKSLINNDFSVLLKLNTPRHIGMFNEVLENDIPYDLKNNKLIWRGTSTGINLNNSSDQRLHLVNKYYITNNPDIDIKFSYLCQNIDVEEEKVGGVISLPELLKSRFLISIEGNDVATNLKWILLSKSVCLMPKPTKCSWFMEDMLIPYLHYVPLADDFSDLFEVYNWCLNNINECDIISKNATKYMEDFLDEENEEYVTNEVIKQYFNYTKFV